MKLIIITLLSVLLTIGDYTLGLELTRAIYGYVVYSILTSLPFTLAYLILIFVIEFTVIFFMWNNGKKLVKLFSSRIK
ncbi:hypothetical protein DJ531_02795 [Sulfolobus sp. A20-N-F6]|uniref:hypothetical protein n=1 Tax=Saccharolobus sp. A20 TaxID=1891280 RepID=UPI0009F1DB8D|nr:hypothetical protein [Sulfolobus sp. A20]TRM74278.1 hypothetical protein DJ532_13225 [Sulfolobus sp. A20-N-F8]TRM77200.1 hypothetical protein DJ528_07125 [Sulfolobus sp. B5]TRM79977.1 hypothetical protein DJ524_09010 [Sulfolobus sp. D5]TRM83984.1 hypothetical protein DJ531_02795 [Sulfolobus sp. A20-N-F6]TRM85838.1 hypothetical protein DJ521_06970 [Sulfolobus sp. E3]TRM86844.1 hypothetical protein DJ529_10230 [Sulfolobus sp. C3]TRM92170.1 hypothetical protein DJ526_06085 [Sulfolobus sp. A2